MSPRETRKYSTLSRVHVPHGCRMHWDIRSDALRCSVVASNASVGLICSAQRNTADAAIQTDHSQKESSGGSGDPPDKCAFTLTRTSHQSSESVQCLSRTEQAKCVLNTALNMTGRPSRRYEYRYTAKYRRYRYRAYTRTSTHRLSILVPYKRSMIPHSSLFLTIAH